MLFVSILISFLKVNWPLWDIVLVVVEEVVVVFDLLKLNFLKIEEQNELFVAFLLLKNIFYDFYYYYH